jgi:molybdopterin converting factor small subunit
MSIAVRLPAMLRQGKTDPLVIEERIHDVAGLIDVLARRVPGFREQLEDAVLNFAVNDELILHDVRSRPLQDGDTVEIVPTISGGTTETSNETDHRDLGGTDHRDLGGNRGHRESTEALPCPRFLGVPINFSSPSCV